MQQWAQLLRTCTGFSWKGDSAVTIFKASLCLRLCWSCKWLFLVVITDSCRNLHFHKAPCGSQWSATVSPGEPRKQDAHLLMLNLGSTEKSEALPGVNCSAEMSWARCCTGRILLTMASACWARPGAVEGPHAQWQPLHLLQGGGSRELGRLCSEHAWASSRSPGPTRAAFTVRAAPHYCPERDR